MAVNIQIFRKTNPVHIDSADNSEVLAALLDDHNLEDATPLVGADLTKLLKA